MSQNSTMCQDVTDSWSLNYSRGWKLFWLQYCSAAATTKCPILDNWKSPDFQSEKSMMTFLMETLIWTYVDVMYIRYINIFNLFRLTRSLSIRLSSFKAATLNFYRFDCWNFSLFLDMLELIELVQLTTNHLCQLQAFPFGLSKWAQRGGCLRWLTSYKCKKFTVKCTVTSWQQLTSNLL